MTPTHANPEYDALLEQARAEGDMDKKFDLYHQLDQMLTEDAAVIPLYYPSLKYLIKPDGSGWGNQQHRHAGI